MRFSNHVLGFSLIFHLHPTRHRYVAPLSAGTGEKQARPYAETPRVHNKLLEHSLRTIAVLT